MDPPAQLAALIVICGFGPGVVFGAVARKSDFCTMGAAADVVNMGDWTRMRIGC